MQTSLGIKETSLGIKETDRLQLHLDFSLRQLFVEASSHHHDSHSYYWGDLQE